MAPHLDKGELVTRAVAAELSLKARIAKDSMENGALIREQIEGEPHQRGCARCGDPYAAINADGKCDLCEQDAKLDGVRDKLSPEELHPEHFSETVNE